MVQGRGHLWQPIRARLRGTLSGHIWGANGGASDFRSEEETERERRCETGEKGEVNIYRRVTGVQVEQTKLWTGVT